MYPHSARALQVDAVFVSAMRRSDELNASQIRRAVTAARNAYGGAGCAERVAQKFGNHPEAEAVRIRWARAAAAILEGSPGPEDRRQMAEAHISAMGGNPAGFLAIRSA